MKNIVRQLFIFIVVTTLLTILLYTFNVNVVLAILTSVLIQFTLYNSYIYIVDSITIARIKKIELEKIKEISKQVASVTCPCPEKNTEYVNIRLDEENYHTCNKCQKKIKTFVNTTTVLATEPIIQTDTQNIKIKK